MAKDKRTDLQKFEQYFGIEPVRITPHKLEFRVRNLDGCLYAANVIIDSNKLNLVAETSGNMAQIRAFEVKVKS